MNPNPTPTETRTFWNLYRGQELLGSFDSLDEVASAIRTDLSELTISEDNGSLSYSWAKITIVLGGN